MLYLRRPASRHQREIQRAERGAEQELRLRFGKSRQHNFTEHERKVVGSVHVPERNDILRYQAISHSSDAHAERQVIEDALASLRALKRENLGFPDWEKK